MRRRVRVGRFAVIVGCALALIVAAGCGGGGDDDGDDESSGPTSTTAPAVADGDVLLLVTSSDGLLAPGLDALVQNLYTQPGTAVTVAAPAAVDPAAPTAVPTGEAPSSTFGPTAGGYPGVEIQADAATTVSAALGGGVEGVTAGAHLVVVGVNDGQLLGPLGSLDSEMLAAQAAVEAGVPALVVAAGSDEVPPDYPAAISQAVSWLEEHRDALLAGDEPAQVTVLNVPGCGFATVRGVVEVPVAIDGTGRDGSLVDCASTVADPVDDIAAFTTGYATLSVIPTAAAPPAVPDTTAAPDTSLAPPTTAVLG